MKTSIRFVLVNLTMAIIIVTLSACTNRQSAGKACCAPATCPAATAVTAETAEPSKPAAAEVPAAEPVDKATLTVVKVDSEETAGEDGRGVNAVDGNSDTFWHTQWQDASPECPHEIIIELSPATTIKGFAYLPRQDDSENGSIKDYEFYVSADDQNFEQPVCKGTFKNSKDKKSVTFEPVKCRFIKLKALSEVNGEAWTSAAEIGVLQ
jgi:hypothetical protein